MMFSLSCFPFVGSLPRGFHRKPFAYMAYLRALNWYNYKFCRDFLQSLFSSMDIYNHRTPIFDNCMALRCQALYNFVNSVNLVKSYFSSQYCAYFLLSGGKKLGNKSPYILFCSIMDLIMAIAAQAKDILFSIQTYIKIIRHGHWNQVMRFHI